MEIYQEFGLEVVHLPGETYGRRLRQGVARLREDYVVFLPDDYVWIFPFPLAAAIEECRNYGIDELKLACRGMKWFAQKNPQPAPWFNGHRVISGERLVPSGNLLVSKRHWRRNFHEQFSLGCHLLRRSFLSEVVAKIPEKVVSAGQAEKHAYLALVFRRYKTGYYKMWIPAFHFIDVSVEGEKNRFKADDMLIENNYQIYNELYNR